MKISVKHYDEEVTISNERNDITFTEFMDMVERLATTIYSESIVKDYWNG